MLFRGLIRAAKTPSIVSRIPSSRTVSPFTISTLLPSRTNLLSPRLAQISQSSARSYSDVAQTKSTEEATSVKEGDAAQAGEVETLKKDLEAKNKEIIELKVGDCRSVSRIHDWALTMIRTNS